MLDSSDEEDSGTPKSRGAGPAIGVSTLEKKRPKDLQSLKMPKLKEPGESLQKN
jgi:serine/threonine protein kinase